MKHDFAVGLEVLALKPEMSRHWGRCALVCNQASIDRHFIPSWQVIQKCLGSRLVVLFGPQHGFVSTVQDNMIESSHATHAPTGLPVYSLYSETREPTEAMLEGVDTIIVDLPVVGCRIYTYKATAAACLRAAKKYGKKVVVLDRANPLGGVFLEGNILDLQMRSFVGEFETPMRHGLTMGEAACFFNVSIGADLEVVKLEGWKPESWIHQHNRPWVLTSPNLPTMDPLFVFCGMVLLEGCNLSEGRGTGLPFQFIGAPYLKDSQAFVSRVLEWTQGAPGLHLRATMFEPTSQKWKGQSCGGMQIHVLEPNKVRAFDLGLAVLRSAIELSDGAFQWNPPPYEYEYTKKPINVLFGMVDADKKVMASDFSVSDPQWSQGISSYVEAASKILLYPREQRLMA